MKIHRRNLMSLNRAYSLARIAGLDKNRLPAFAAGSEDQGPLVLFEPPDYLPRVLAESPGGFISLCSYQLEGSVYLLASCNFFPGFQGADCRIIRYNLNPYRIVSREVMSLPYTHRITTTFVGQQPCFLASTLCSKKDFKDDWAHPGGIEIIPIPSNLESSWEPRKILQGLNKNHGFDRTILRDQEGFLISAMEGLFWLPIPNSLDDAWNPFLVASGEHSDAWANCWNGEDVIFTISPFHGNILSVYREKNGYWIQQVICEDLAFGHIVWAGNFLGKPALLAGSRRNRQELRLYQSVEIPHAGTPYTLIDEGIGAAQITILASDDHSILLVVTAQAENQVVLYEITN